MALSRNSIYFLLIIAVFILIVTLIFDPILFLNLLVLYIIISILITICGLDFWFSAILIRNLVDNFIDTVLIPEYQEQKLRSLSEGEEGVLQLIRRE